MPTPEQAVAAAEAAEAAKAAAKAARHVERAIFVVVELAKPALLSRHAWLRAALSSPEEPRSCLGSFQGWYHGREAPRQGAHFAAFNTQEARQREIEERLASIDERLADMPPAEQS